MRELLKENNNGVVLYDAFSYYINTPMENNLWKHSYPDSSTLAKIK